MEVKWLWAEDVAENYGVKISTVWSWVRKGKIRAYKVGRRYRFKEHELPEEIR